MAENTKIEWAHHSFNPWIGCTKVSPGCDHCYAEADFDKRKRVVQWGAGQPRHRTASSTWAQPLRWNRQAELLGIRYRVFCASLADVFDNEVHPEWRHDLFNLIRDTPNLDWLLLTKRPQNIKRMVRHHGCVAGNGTSYLPGNVWLGATAENQERADINVPALLNAKEFTGAKVAFLSMEPLLGPVDLNRIHEHGRMQGGGSWDSWESCLTGRRFDIWADGDTDGWPKLDWVIVGGESGPGARPMHPDWSRSLRDQCQAAGVAFLFKQWGEWCPRGPESLGYPSVEGVPRFRMTDAGHNGQDLGADGGNDVWMNRAGKKAAGRLLDGRTWDEVPA